MKKISFIALLLTFCVVFSALSVFAETETASSGHIDAEYEDSGISLWFDYATEKKVQSDVTTTGMETFMVYMAQNEIENAQFYLAADSERTGLNADITAFTDASGNTIDTSLYIEYYHDAGNFGMLPDAIPPVDAYVETNGGISLSAGKSQGFIIKLKTTLDTVPGDYSATLNIYDAEGKQIKTAEVKAHVWDFELSEETACATSVNLAFGYLKSVVEDVDTFELYKIYYDFMLENRISAYYLPFTDLTTADALAYMDNPRVTSFQIGSIGGQLAKDLAANQVKRIVRNFRGEENAHRFEKAYMFSDITDAKTAAELEELKAAYDSLYSSFSTSVPDYADGFFYYLNTYINDIDYTVPETGEVIDQIDYYDDFVNFWCTKPFAYTRYDELGVSGAKVLQAKKWDSVYGTFKERMAKEKAEGDKVWWYVSDDVSAPYINYYMQTDGVAQRVLFWQQYDNDVDGFLYNFVNFWLGNTKDPYTGALYDGRTDQYGEWVLLYPGDVYGIPEVPVSSLRFEAMRDGIEDYQYFAMLEEILGEGAADNYIDLMTTGVTQYSVDDAKYYEARVLIGELIESGGEGVETECAHEYVQGVCSKCGELDHAIEAGDMNRDGSISISDFFALKGMLISVEPTEIDIKIGDLNENGSLDISDFFSLKAKLLS